MNSPFLLMGTPNSVLPRAISKTVENGSIISPRGLTTKELNDVVIQYKNPEYPFTFAYGRMINLAFAMAEVIWILSGRRDVEMVGYFNKQIKEYSDDGEVFNAAYGHRMRHWGTNAGNEDPLGNVIEGYDQLNDAVKKLQKDPMTRQAVMSYTDLYRDGVDRDTKDRPCNTTSHFLLRDGKLNLIQTMRSNDVIWGAPYNLIQWSHVLQYVAAQLQVPVGTLTFHISSLHVYGHQLEEVSDIKEWDPYTACYDKKRCVFYESRMPSDTNLDWLAYKLNKLIHDPDFHPLYTEPTDMMHPYWRPYFQVFRAYRAFKEHQNKQAFDITTSDIPFPFNVLLLKNFWNWRYHKEEFESSQLEKEVSEFVQDQSPGGWLWDDDVHAKHVGVRKLRERNNA